MIDPLLIAQLGKSCFGCPAFLLVLSEKKKHQRLGTILGLCSNPFWWTMVIATEQWVAVPIHLMYTFGWLRKAYMLFWKKQ